MRGDQPTRFHGQYIRCAIYTVYNILLKPYILMGMKRFRDRRIGRLTFRPLHTEDQT